MADGIIFRNTDGAKWGAGKGSALTSLEGDENNWEFLQRIQAIEGNPPLPVSIANITVVGSQFQVELTDGSSLGPYALPVATFELKGEWVNDMLYHELDMVSVANRGLYLVRIEHTTPSSPAIFDPTATDGGGNPLYLLLFGEDEYIYDIGFFFPGKPGIGIDDGEAMAGFTFDRDVTLPAGLPGSVARLKTGGAAAMDFKIQVNGADAGNIHFNLGATTGAFTFDDAVECVAGDTVTILKPDDGIDTNARQFSATIKGQRLFE
jgi:hypothetical protein